MPSFRNGPTHVHYAWLHASLQPCLCARAHTNARTQAGGPGQARDGCCAPGVHMWLHMCMYISTHTCRSTRQYRSDLSYGLYSYGQCSYGPRQYRSDLHKSINACTSVRMTARMSAHAMLPLFVFHVHGMSVHVSMHMSVHVSIQMSVHMTIAHVYTHDHCTCLYTRLYTRLYTYLYACLYTCLCTCLCTCLYKCPHRASCPCRRPCACHTARAHMSACAHMSVHVSACMSSLPSLSHSCMSMRISARRFAHMSSHMSAYMSTQRHRRPM